MPENLSKAVSDAAAELTARGGTKTEGGAEPEVKTDAEGSPEVEMSEGEVADGEPEDSESETVEDLSEAELVESKNLYKALRDPATRGPILAALAQQAGLQLGAAPSKVETREAARTIQQAVKESLGKEYEFLADRLGSAIENA